MGWSSSINEHPQITGRGEGTCVHLNLTRGTHRYFLRRVSADKSPPELIPKKRCMVTLIPLTPIQFNSFNSNMLAAPLRVRASTKESEFLWSRGDAPPFFFEMFFPRCLFCSRRLASTSPRQTSEADPPPSSHPPEHRDSDYREPRPRLPFWTFGFSLVVDEVKGAGGRRWGAQRSVGEKSHSLHPAEPTIQQKKRKPESGATPLA